MQEEPLNIETIAEDPLFVEIRSLDFIGSIIFSVNRLFALAFADNCRLEDGLLRSGSRPSGKGSVLLLKEKRLVWQKQVPRPLYAAVSNTGSAAICDIGFRMDLRSNLLVFREDGSPAVNQAIEANLLSCAITPLGDFAFFKSAGSVNPGHSSKLFAYTLPSGEHAFTVDFFIDRLTSANSEDGKVEVIADGITFQYSRSGVLLNKFETAIALVDRNMFSGYYATVQRLLSECTKTALHNEQLGVLRLAYERLLASAASSDVKAQARRDVGDLYLGQGDKMQALAQFREAVKLNPKIGLMRRIAELENETTAERP